MLHPSYSELIKVVNSDVEEGEAPVVNSRYSIVLATAKRARQIIDRQSTGDLDVPVISNLFQRQSTNFTKERSRSFRSRKSLKKAEKGTMLFERSKAV